MGKLVAPNAQGTEAHYSVYLKQISIAYIMQYCYRVLKIGLEFNKNLVGPISSTSYYFIVNTVDPQHPRIRLSAVGCGMN